MDYQQRLSRGRVPIKWWLSCSRVPDRGNLRRSWEFGRNAAWRITCGGGLITLLALIAAVILAISGRYPQRIFDLVMGLNRWCCRVLAYATLMRDEYPPFRPDTGGTDPGHHSHSRSARTATGPHGQPLVTTRRRTWTGPGPNRSRHQRS